jgi:hypothetical protein
MPQKKGNPVTDYNLNIGNRYEVINRISGISGYDQIYLGNSKECRFCGQKQADKFRNTAHTFPEFLGNKNIFSLDECDDCNKTFAQYDSALAEMVRPYLTLSGAKGKTKKIPQTGRTDSGKVLRRHEGGERPRISWALNTDSIQDYISADPFSKKIKFTMPVPFTRVIPRHAYKALSKIGVALLPADELHKFDKLKRWLQDPKDSEDFHYLEVVSSLGSVTNPLPIVDGVLLRRIAPEGCSPYMIFIFAAGSFCFQIDLMSDSEENEEFLRLPGTEIIQWNTTISGRSEQTPLIVKYKGHHIQNWASPSLEANPLKSMSFDIQIGS